MISQIKSFFSSLKPKDSYYYLSQDFEYLCKNKYAEHTTHYRNNHKIFLLSCYEWYIDRRPVVYKINKHPFFPNMLEFKFFTRLSFLSILGGFFLGKIIRKINKKNRINISLFIGVQIFMIGLSLIATHKTSSAYLRKIYFLDIMKLDKINYEHLDISEKEVIRQLRNYNIKLNYKY